MSLAQKTLAIVLLTVTGLTVVLYMTTRFVMLRSFLRLEKTETRSAVNRAHNALNDNISSLAATTSDYAAWDRTYEFMEHPSSAYIEQEFQYDTLQGVTVNSVMLVNTRGKIVFFRKYDLVQQRQVEIPLSEQLQLASASWVRRATEEPTSGIVLMPDGLTLVAAHPILTTNRQGPTHGVLVLMRSLNAQQIERLGAETRSALRITPLSQPRSAGGIDSGIVVKPANDQLVSGYEFLPDIEGTPVLKMELAAPRPVFAQGVESLHYFLGALCIASVAFGAVSLLLLRYAVLARVSDLSLEVRRIADLKKLSARVAVRSEDELGRLGGSINDMLKALENSDLQFRNIAENIHQVFWVENAASGKMEYVSLAYENVWGRSRDEVYEQPLAWMESIHPQDRELVEAMRGQQKLGKIGATEYRILLPDGVVCWVYNRYFPVQDEQGKIKQMVALTENITEFKKAEEVLLRSQDELEHLVELRTGELAKANASLAEKEEHFRQLFSTIPLPVWLFSEETFRFLEVNDAAVEHYGYSREEFLLMTVDEIRPPEEILRLRQDLAEPRPDKSFSRGGRHRIKDGRLLDVEISSSRVRFAGVPSVLVAAHDVTERMRMEVELRHGQKLQAVGELAAGIAHEINTPIQFVGSNVQFLQGAFTDLVKLLEEYEKVCPACTGDRFTSIQGAREAADLPFMRKEIPLALEQTIDGVERVSTIVQALKTFSHVDWGPEKGLANLSEAIASTLVVAASEMKYVADVETSFGDLPPVPCHLGDLNQVFLNLLVNAAHAIADVAQGTGARGKIKITTTIEEEHAVVAISDTGAGIPLHIRSRIFDPFFTTKAVGKGTGQGLALARAIVVDKHGGTLTFDSRVGEGTTFYVRIPLVAPLSEPAPVA